MASALWQVGLGLAATAAAYPITRKWDNHVSRKRKFEDEGIDLSFDNKRVKLTQPLRNMPIRRRRRGRRIFRGRRRVFKRTSRFRKRGGFKRAVRRVIFRTKEAKKYDDAIVSGFAIAEGDGTSRVTYVTCPAFGLAQGDESDMFDGNKFWLKGYSIRGQVGTSGDVTNRQGCWIRISLVWSREQNPQVLFGGWNAYNSTTTSATNPTATSPNVNPRFFEGTTVTEQFVGNGWQLPFDRTNCKVITSKTIVVNPGAENQAGEGIIALPTPFKFFFPVNKAHQVRDPAEGDLSNVALTFKHGAYYLVMQALSNTNDVTAQTIAEMDYKLTAHFREI